MLMMLIFLLFISLFECESRTDLPRPTSTKLSRNKYCVFVTILSIHSKGTMRVQSPVATRNKKGKS